MPLLRKKPFVPEKQPSSLKPDDEVFYCEYTGEIFIDYEAYYQRMILCNSLVWSCECTGKPNLTYKEAKDSEECVKKSLAAFPEPLKRSVLSLVHHTKRSKISDLTDEIYDYLKVRYQLNEEIELKIKDKWVTGKIISLPDKTNVNLLKSPQKSPQKSLKSPSKDKENDGNAANKSVSKSPLGHKNQWPDHSTAEYKVSLTKGSEGDKVCVKGKNVRRSKGVFLKEKVRLYIRQTCARTTASSDEGYWVVMPPAISTFNLGASTVLAEDSGKSTKKQRKLTSKNSKKKEKEQSKSKSPTKKVNKEKEKSKKTKSESKPMTLEEKRKQYLKEKEKEKEMKLLEIEMAKMKKLREKEEEKARKKDEREKEKELANEVKKLEIDFSKEFSRLKEDLRLEDLKSLPTLCPMKCDLEQDLIGDAMMIIEFIHIFGGLFEVDEELDGKINLDWIQEALTEHDAEGKYFQILHFFLHSYLKFEQEENIHTDDEDEELSSESEDEKDTANIEEEERNETSIPKKPSSNARAAAAWPMLHQGLALHEITIEPFSLTEVLRLHILSSGAKLGSIKNHNEWQHRGQFQFSDDPCVSFRHTEIDIMKKLSVSSVYDLTASEKLKILVLMCNQMLMLNVIRDHMEDTNDKLKALRKKLREIQHEENQRRKAISKEKWKKTLAERKKKQEEIEKRKQEKKAEAERGEKDNKLKEKQAVEETPKETQEELDEKKRKKEAKEMQVEEFYREKFLFKEREIMKEINRSAAAINESPLGRDRTFKRYWRLSAIDGIIVENDDDGAAILLDLNRHEKEDMDFESDEEIEDDEVPMKQNSPDSPVPAKKNFPKVTLEEIMQAKDEGPSFEELLLKRYKCQFSSKTNELIERSNMLQSHINNVKNGVDPAIYSTTDQTKWYTVNSKEQFLAVIDSLNNRGVREQNLLSNFNNEKSQIINQYLEAEKEEERLANKRVVKPTQKKIEQAIDKSLFKSMEEFIEASLRDSILELEERIWIAGFGGVTGNRGEWRKEIEEGMTKLIQVQGETQNTSDEVKPAKESLVNGFSESENVSNGHHDENGISESNEMEVDDETKKPIKAIPLHLKDGEKDENERSRCSTPVDEFTGNDRIELVKELADALLRVEQCTLKKYVKPPLGETAETKKERLKEQIEAGGKGDLSTSKEEEKKPSTSLTRWEESLSKCSSFSQVFVHLNTLDRSISWDKSIQNVKCRLCRRKGNEDEMLLCDGCDRGFHMSCLKPAMKNVPVGDWYCKDCKPVEVKRRNRKSSRVVEETEEEETEEEDTEEEDDDEDESEEEESDEEEEESEDDNEEEDDDDESGSEHGESCTVCDGEGTLILCENCPRSFHVECCYPPLRKVPRGDWICQICKGTDTDLPYRRRAATIEKKREKSKSEGKKSKALHFNRKQRGMPAPSAAPVKRSQNSSNDSSRPKKRAKLENDDSQSSSSQKSTVSVGRQQLKQCTLLLNEIMKRDEAEPFLAPVDAKEVPDYLDFVDNPMDFATIKIKLNTAKYLDVHDFLNDIQQVFTNCETYNPPRSQVARDGSKLKTFVKKKVKEFKLD